MSETVDRPATGMPHTLVQDLSAVLNKHSAENGSNTPDFILAQLVEDLLTSFDAAVVRRDKWWGRSDDE